jgi:MauM/NapG family ferredoxin protein
MSLDRRHFLTNVTNLAGATAAAGAAAGLWSREANASPAPIRPPGALPEDEFVSTCIRCMRCVDACPNHCIESIPVGAGRADAGTPQIEPRKQACMLCSRIDGDYLRCGEACPTGALQPIRKTLEEVQSKVRMGVAEIDLNLCYSYNNYTCGTCYHACPLNDLAIKVGLWERPQVIADACIGCGLCERACIRYPQAIRVKPVDRPDLRDDAAAAPAGHREARRRELQNQFQMVSTEPSP